MKTTRLVFKAKQFRSFIYRGSDCPRDDRHPVHHLLQDHLRVLGPEEEELEEDQTNEAAAQNQLQREARQQLDGKSLLRFINEEK